NAFYQNLLELKDVELALRKAKIDWLQDEHQNKIMLLPYYWDSLIYTGNSQKVYLKKQLFDCDIMILGAITVLIFLTFLIVKITKRKSSLKTGVHLFSNTYL